MNIKEEKIQLTDEAMVLSFTDGLPELRNNNDEYFNDVMLERFVDKNGHLDPESFNVKLLNEVDLFRGDNDITDDIAVLTCKIY